MSTDPLECRRQALFQQVEYTIVQVRVMTLYWPNLLAAGIDPVRIGAELGELHTRAREADVEARTQGIGVRVAELDCDRALSGVAAWQKRVRAWMKVAPNNPVAARAVADVRKAVGGRVLRFAASVRIARAGIAALEAGSAALSESVKVADLVEQGRACLADLSEAVANHALQIDRRKEMVAVARADDRALRKKIRYLRLCWNIARSESPKTMRPLNLWIAKADVASRAWRNRGRKRLARGLPVGRVAGVGSARVPPPVREGAPPGAPWVGEAR
jgi:hypothetical protein